jgi:hypothetical protein
VKFSAPVVGGIVFAILFVLGMIMMNLPVGGGASSDDEIREFYANSDDRTRVVISTYLLALAAVAFMPFLAGLYYALRRTVTADPSDNVLPLGALIAGIAFIALLMAGAAALGAIAGGIQLGDEPELLADTGIARFLGHTGYALILIMGAFSAAAMIAMASARIVQHPGIAARWVAWAGFVLAAILLVAVIFLPMVALPMWVLIACFTILPGNSVGESAPLGSRAGG